MDPSASVPLGTETADAKDGDPSASVPLCCFGSAVDVKEDGISMGARTIDVADWSRRDRISQITAAHLERQYVSVCDRNRSLHWKRRSTNFCTFIPALTWAIGQCAVARMRFWSTRTQGLS